MNAEDPVARLFDRVVQDLNPALDVLVEQGERQGRKLRARRRVRLAVGNSLAVAAVVGVAVAVSAQGSKPGADDSAGLSSTASPHPSASPIGKASATASAKAATTAQMLDTLRALVPAGGTFLDARSAWGPGTLQVDFDDGHGPVDILLFVGRPSPGDAPLVCPTPLWKDEGPRPKGALPISCAARTLPDGSLELATVTNADSLGFYGYDIYDLRPDGVEVSIQVANGTNHGTPQVDRAIPPGSMAQWTAIVQNPAWRP
jgi:hypothetical protein